MLCERVYTPDEEPLSTCQRQRRMHLHVRAGGERFPLVYGPDGLPEIDLFIYTAAWIRPRSGSINTSLQRLRGAIMLKNYCDVIGIDLGGRIRDGAFLHLHEQTGFDAFLSSTTDSGAATRGRRIADALRYCHFQWRRRASELSGSPSLRAEYLAEAAEFRREFEAVIPVARPSLSAGGARDGGSYRVGLSDRELSSLVALIASPAAVAAVWEDPFARLRNAFLIRCFLLLGHRVGELLSLLVDDVDLDGREYTVRRSHDSPDDPRVLQPLVKGFERRLRWPAALVGDGQSYLRARAALPHSAWTPFLLVTREGHPLSRSMVAKVFWQVRDAVAELPRSFSPHVLRHTWNDMFSAAADALQMPAEKEIRGRMLAMGWVSRGTAATYTKRSDKKAADEVSAGIQDRILNMMAGD